MEALHMKNTLSQKKHKVQTLQRALDLIEILADLGPEESLTKLSRRARLSLSTTHRILNALKCRGYVEQNPKTSEYKLTLKFFEIGNMVVRHLSLREEAVPVLRDLAEKTGESAHLIVLDKDEGLCLERIDGHHHLRVLFVEVGGRIPLHVGAGSRVLFAYLPEQEMDRIVDTKGLRVLTKRSIADADSLRKDAKKIREQGYALSFGDVAEGAAGLGCPVRNWRGEVVAAISIAGVSSHFSKDRIPGLIEIVKDGACELSRRLSAP